MTPTVSLQPTDTQALQPQAWQGFHAGNWQTEINVRDFIARNLTPYTGNGDFLAQATPRTEQLWAQVCQLFQQERDAGGVLAVDATVASSITAHGAGYIDKGLERIVGLQTSAPLKRAIMPEGGLRMVLDGCKEQNTEVSPVVVEAFTRYRKTHNEGVFSAYTPAMRDCRKSGIITGLPDAYGRGRIIGDYRRLALYGSARLLADKQAQKALTDEAMMSEAVIREREELTEQLNALKAIETMAKAYGFDVSQPAATAQEAIQWTYFAYLAAIKDQNGAAMSLGRVSSFLDIYIQRDLQAGRITEAEAQELMDDFVIKLRLVRFLRTHEYDALFSGDPVWVTECIGGQSVDGRTFVTRNSFRMLHTLRTLGPSPEPNLTVLWSRDLPEGFKRFCAAISIDTSSVQYENDDQMRPIFGDDYGIACCVSPMKLGKEMQFFGARANLAKTLLYAINGGKDEISGEQIAPAFAPITAEILNYDEVLQRFDAMMGWLANVYVNSLNIIHAMHDKYAYEKAQMAFYDKDVRRTLGCGIAGLSVVADSLAAIKYGKVKVQRNEAGIAVGFEQLATETLPRFGNDDDRVDTIAIDVQTRFMNKLRGLPTYRQAEATQSVLTITSNVVYGKKTGCTPDGRQKGEPFAPGANPMHGRDERGALASLNSVAKLPFSQAMDGISNTFSIVPSSLGADRAHQQGNLTALLDGYFAKGGHHMNVNVLNRDTLLHAMEHPEEYPQLTIRVSGYAVHFIKLTREQQMDVVARTFHQAL
jgi:formate C-acetyltransferase